VANALLPNPDPVQNPPSMASTAEAGRRPEQLRTFGCWVFSLSSIRF